MKKYRIMVDKNICRACLSEKIFENLYDWYLFVADVNEPLTYQECFQLCTQLDVKKADSVSPFVKDVHFLCTDCVQELISSFRFMRKAQKSANELYQLAQRNSSSHINANAFEWVNIKNLCKAEESRDVTQTSEHIYIEGGTTNVEEISTLSPESKIHKHKNGGDENPLLSTVFIPSEPLLNNTKLNTPRTENEKLEQALKLEAFEGDSSVKKEKVEDIEDEAFIPFPEITYSQEVEAIEKSVCSTDSENKKNSAKYLKVKEPTVERVRTKHTKVKNNDKEFKQISCEHCKKLFPENKLKQHLSRYHRPKIFLCDICPSSFSIANNLRRHQRTHDLNRERNFTCEDCGRKFFTEDVYRTHIKIHQSTRQPEFKCSECDKVFMHKGSLTLHIQKHTGPKNECSICKKRYVRKIDLEVHMRNHSGDLPYQCSKCGKAFMTTSALRKHELLHSGIRYKCDICNKEYSHPSKLNRHRLDHTGLPLKCGMCNKGFSEPNKIRRHISSVHKVEDIGQINNLTIRVPRNDSNSRKDSKYLQ